jgi:hypothetical protein
MYGKRGAGQSAASAIRETAQTTTSAGIGGMLKYLRYINFYEN